MIAVSSRSSDNCYGRQAIYLNCSLAIYSFVFCSFCRILSMVYRNQRQPGNIWLSSLSISTILVIYYSIDFSYCSNILSIFLIEQFLGEYCWKAGGLTGREQTIFVLLVLNRGCPSCVYRSRPMLLMVSQSLMILPFDSARRVASV